MSFVNSHWSLDVGAKHSCCGKGLIRLHIRMLRPYMNLQFRSLYAFPRWSVGTRKNGRSGACPPTNCAGG